uniref:Uncharacterized protein n=1 Tax=Nelumbo nucifera TaxID=4432 RepID=A0A822ZQC1_NELNU|nr:TPA_asm: hypothetical protein HUJ06_016990 [Nelumbo nucifera]
MSNLGSSCETSTKTSGCQFFLSSKEESKK